MAGGSVGRGRRDPGARWHHVDGVLVAAAVSLALLGCLMIYSASCHGLAARDLDPLSSVKRQAGFVAIGLVGMGVTAAIDLRRLRRAVPLLYLGAVTLLLAVLSPLGTEVNGARSWFAVGSFQLQPAELAKLATIVAVAGACARWRGVLDGRGLAVGLGLAVVPAGLVLLQPDLGSALVFAVVSVAMVLVAGARPVHLLGLGVLAVISVVGVLHLDLLDGYQRDRLTAFASGGTVDQRGAGFQLDQSMTTVAAGGLVGTGLFQGTQTRLGFVPEQQTDFIFTVVGEELGFVGSVALLALYAVVAWRSWRAGLLARDHFDALVCTGVLAMIAFHVFQNMGMAMGIMPITGIPLPLVSSGGSATVTVLAGLGLVLNVHMRRFT
jgi:rod shape determining protein RodA